MTLTIPRISKSISIALSILIALVVQPNITGSAASAYFFYFNPDSVHSNLSGLKQTVDAVLTAEGLDFSFQPFTRFQDFNRQVKAERPALLFLPSWYLKQDGNDKKYKPFMVPVRRGATTYRKVLLVNADSMLTMDTIHNTTIAMTPVGQAGMETLNEALFKGAGIRGEKLSIITTAKDADALFALALGQVKAAIISQDNLERISSINPRILATVKRLAESAPIPLPILCYAEGTIDSARLEKLRCLLRAGKQDTHIAKLMEQLDIDAWKEPTP